MSLKRRLEQLEGWQSIPRATFWDVLCGTADPDDLDDAGRALMEKIAQMPDEIPDTIDDELTRLSRKET